MGDMSNGRYDWFNEVGHRMAAVMQRRLRNWIEARKVLAPNHRKYVAEQLTARILTILYNRWAVAKKLDRATADKWLDQFDPQTDPLVDESCSTPRLREYVDTVKRANRGRNNEPERRDGVLKFAAAKPKPDGPDRAA